MEREVEMERVRQVPRLCYSPDRGASPRQISPRLPIQGGSQENWAASTRTSPFLTNGSNSHSSVREQSLGQHYPVFLHHVLWNENYPWAVAHLQTAIDHLSSRCHIHELPYLSLASHHTVKTVMGILTTTQHDISHYPQDQLTRTYNTPYQDFVRFGDMSSASLSGDNKQRKRRGNLPKETTDKLRAWFVAHLQHPYPTEDEKQDLMRQTGLQMNQISNWFINARRRQLPAMINNARAETDAMTGARGGDLKVLATTERGDFDHSKREPAGPLSDSEGATYDEELEALSQRRPGTIGRGSV
ncbi:hypothetical protein LB503_006501 [Fusarium chuoi]|nr:hypothetical protein LB503_006501 [Fusarium chuoi]